MFNPSSPRTQLISTLSRIRHEWQDAAGSNSLVEVDGNMGMLLAESTQWNLPQTTDAEPLGLHSEGPEQPGEFAVHPQLLHVATILPVVAEDQPKPAHR